MPLIKLTDWETGKPVYVDPAAIKSMRELEAKVFDPIMEDDSPCELGERTRIDTDRDTFLVREKAEEILAFITT